MSRPGSDVPAFGHQLEQSFDQRFDAIAQSCRAYLTGSADPARIALAPLHLRNAHPETLAQYPGVFAPQMSWRGHLHQGLKTRLLPAAAALRKTTNWIGDPLPGRADLLVLSHFTAMSQAASYEDLYFGALPARWAAETGQEVVVAALNHTWAPPEQIMRTWQTGPTPRLILARLSPPRTELTLASRLRRAARALPQLDEPGADQIRTLVQKTTPSGPALTALRIYDQVGKLVRHLRPRLLLSTFEGHAWERLAFQAARNADPNIRCIGYHHSVLFPKMQAPGWALGHGFDPDALLTAGEVGAEWFAAQPDWHETPVMPLGSVRAPAPVNAGAKDAHAGQTTCLVAPEGILSETLFLFQTALDAARRAPQRQFVLRLHPLMARADIQNTLPELRNPPPNMRWSTASLDADLAQAEAVFYRGSTVVMSAALSGVRPIYLSRPSDPVSVDPLSALTSPSQTWHQQVQTAAALCETLTKGYSAQAKTKAQNFCARYFRPLDISALHRITDALERL